jgi:hypothetical protein
VTLGVFGAAKRPGIQKETNMAKEKGKEKASRKPKYDQGKVLKLWEAGKSISEIADAMKPISKVFVHRLLTTKFTAQYEAGQKERAAAREKAAK